MPEYLINVFIVIAVIIYVVVCWFMSKKIKEIRHGC